jgi:DNA topoisomerase-1
MAKVKGLVIVESPAKAKKISSYLGEDYTVLASMGHVRDLPANASEVPAEFKKSGWGSLGVNVEQGFDPLYVVPAEKKKVVKELKDALKNAEELILATDEDREGESIGWHLAQLLEPKVPVKRMVFSEITKDAIKKAIATPRKLDENLVTAQETRRVLDRLYGYTLSPLLWKKIARGLSAGRVQSVAVRVLVLRELERLAFRSGSYWDLQAQLKTKTGQAFAAHLHRVEGRRVATGKDFDEATGKLKADADVVLLDGDTAAKLRDSVANSPWKIAKIEFRNQVRKPYPPFTTSTLQQESNRKLGLTARQTMQTAQRLYEQGFITYMRTDSVNLSTEAIDAARNRVVSLYGKEFLHNEVRQFSTKAKGAQEAHEAIRPAGTEMRTGEELGLSGVELKLYAMIWKRTMATQMAEAQLKFQTVTIESDRAEFRATGRYVEFPGFFRAYVEGVDDPEAALDDQETALPQLAESTPIECAKVEALAHETKPPARFTEATLVRTLEAEGIGRPSTYASIIGTIQDRGYVRKNGNQLVPTFTAVAVNKLLEDYFPRLVDLKFTAQMEQTLDDIASGEAERLPYLTKFYSGAEGIFDQVKDKETAIDPRAACTLRLDGISAPVRVGRYGPYFEAEKDGEVVTASIPADMAPADITNETAEKLIALKKSGPQSIGVHAETGLEIYVLNGPFGPYLQLGQPTEEKKPKRVGIPKNYDPMAMTLETATALISLPRRLGHHPETNKVVNAGIGRFGPYVLHDGKYKSLNKDQDVLTIDLDAAVELLKQVRDKAGATPLRDLGKHPEDQGQVAIFEGRYGAYVKHGKVNATIPKDTDINSVTLEDAIRWLAERVAKGGGKAASRKGGKKAKAAPAADSGDGAVAEAPKKRAKKAKAAESVAETEATAAPAKQASKKKSSQKVASSRKATIEQ